MPLDFKNAADRNVIGKHVEIIVVPLVYVVQKITLAAQKIALTAIVDHADNTFRRRKIKAFLTN